MAFCAWKSCPVPGKCEGSVMVWPSGLGLSGPLRWSSLLPPHPSEAPFTHLCRPWLLAGGFWCAAAGRLAPAADWPRPRLAHLCESPGTRPVVRCSQRPFPLTSILGSWLAYLPKGINNRDEVFLCRQPGTFSF